MSDEIKKAEDSVTGAFNKMTGKGKSSASQAADDTKNAAGQAADKAEDAGSQAANKTENAAEKPTGQS
jgi:hypothetical protein